MKLKYILFLFFIILFISCDKSSTGPGTENSFGGIVQTDSVGRIISDDSTQWPGRINLFDNHGIVPIGWGFGPAYPNPSFSDSIIIPFVTPLRIKTTILCYARTGLVDNVVDTVYSGLCVAGIHYFNYKRKLPKGIYRIQLSMDNSSFSSFGNIQFK